jgi:threonine/homoserine/homoserine lactone efflux protein
MTIETIIALLTALLILAAVPGPGVYATVAHSISYGFLPALAMVAGIATGDLVFALAAVSGLSVLAKTFSHAFMIVKIAGGVWLIWLGVNAWRTGIKTEEGAGSCEKGNAVRPFVTGFFITLGNPKVILFYAGLFPTFIDLSALTLRDAWIVLCIVFIVVFLVLAAYALAASHARALLSKGMAARILSRTAGILMIGAGILVAAR